MKRKKIFVVLLSIVSILFTSIPVNAQENFAGNDVELLYENIVTATTTLSIPTSGDAICYAKLTCQTSKSLKIEMSLQKKNGSTWTTIKTWTKNDTSGITLSLSETKSLSSGSYRLKTKFTCGNEVVTKNSATKTK